MTIGLPLFKQVSPPGVPRSGRVTAAASDMGSPDGVGGGGGSCPAWDPRTWLVLYCGANAKVEEVRSTSATQVAFTGVLSFVGVAGLGFKGYVCVTLGLPRFISYTYSSDLMFSRR